MTAKALHSSNAVLDLGGITAEFLSQADGNCILQVCPANLQDLVELPCLCSKGPMQIVQCRKEVFLNAFQC